MAEGDRRQPDRRVVVPKGFDSTDAEARVSQMLVYTWPSITYFF